jgi:hypothetical protein
MSKNKANRPHPRPFTDGKRPAPATMAVDARPSAGEVPSIRSLGPYPLTRPGSGLAEIHCEVGFVADEEET